MKGAIAPARHRAAQATAPRSSWHHHGVLPLVRVRAVTLALVLVGLVGGLCIALFVDPRFAVAGDAHYSFATARSLAYDGDLDLANQYRVMGDRFGLARHRGSDGVVLPPREIGTALLMVPGLCLHHLANVPDALEPFFAVAPAMTALALCFLIATRGFGDALDPAWAIAAVLGGVLPFYAVGRAGYSHAPDAIACGLLVVALLQAHARPSMRSRILCGLAFALALLVRLQNGLFLAWPLVAALASADARSRKNELHTAAVMLGLGGLGLLPQIATTLLHPGSPLGLLRWRADFFDFDFYFGDLARVCFGSHGFFTATPLSAFAVAGLCLGSLRASERGRTLPALVVLALMLFLMAATRDPEGGTAYGARRLCGLTITWTLGFAAFADAGSRAREALRAAVLIGVAANVVVTVAALTGRVSP